ncbi:hypothetical protein WA158_000466 [Blastocystis sp. Blastoise]
MFAINKFGTITKSFTQLRSFAKVVNSTKGKGLPKPREAAIVLTPAAVDRCKYLLNKKPQGTGIYLSTVTKGCNGHQYSLNYVKQGEEGPLDEVVEQDGIRVVIDADSIMYVIGTKIDFQENDFATEFVFDNPLATATCGCGESFSTDEGASSKSCK